MRAFILTMFFFVAPLCEALRIQKTPGIALTDFSNGFIRILNSIGSINLHDIKDIVDIPLINAELIFNNVQILNLVAPDIPGSIFSFRLYEDCSSIINTEDINVSADLEFDWSFRIGGVATFWGTYRSKVETKKMQLNFTFYSNSSKSVKSLSFTLEAKNPSIDGHGTFDFVVKAISDLVEKKVFALMNEELSRYNELMVHSMIYEGLYEDIPVSLNGSVKYLILNKPIYFKYYDQMGKCVTFTFLSYSFDKEERNKVPMPTNYRYFIGGGTDLNLFFEYDLLKQLFMETLKNYTRSPYTIEAKQQKCLFGCELTVFSLVDFYPQLARSYNLNDKITVSFRLHPNTTEGFVFTFNFTLTDSKVLILSIDKLVMYGSLGIHTEFYDRGQEFTVLLREKVFTAIEVWGNKMARYNAIRLMTFMQPVAQFFHTQAQYTVRPLRPVNSWKKKGVYYHEEFGAIMQYTRALPE